MSGPGPRRVPCRERLRAKLRWRCRRGMKELDLLLERFRVRDFEYLNDGQLDLLERLLDASDLDLLDCLSGTREPGEESLVQFVRWMRERIAFGAAEPRSSTARESPPRPTG